MITLSPVYSVSSRLQSGRHGLNGWVRLGLMLTGLGSFVFFPGITATVQANNPCEVNSTSAVCCNGQSVLGTLPNLSASFAQDLCQILIMPTASRSESENFLSQIEPNSLLTNASASAEAMTLPSMWWTRDSIPPQLGRHRLVDSWVSYTIQGSEVRVVDVMINSQFWRALTMPQRYGVLSKFGTSAQEFGYHLRFFQNNGYSARMIGLYGCEGTPAATQSLTETTPNPTSCLISVDTTRLVQWQQAAMPSPDWLQPASLPSASVNVAEVSPTETETSPTQAEQAR